ncbi:hypothetical protein JRI60_10195 [Archangium violaceum]|uniref:hypothetical protein n=1 Tax=Archangium violaceum TaxID=83451 RepID=UPI00194FD436|nr:hypothetical protein [Archangium violaceum]QRN99356.1 hypothetical protein JRI60_10195 [Archangium violaceum]
MGWIRERMEELEPPVHSISELAQRVRKASSWPKAEKLKASSLATYLGKFDEGEALEWLEERPGVLQALADVLEMNREDLGEHLAQLRSRSETRTLRLKLRDVPTRPIDLRHEPLPPGLPPQVLEPASWPMWWYAPGGAGRTLVGEWLEARGLAVFIQAQTWVEAESQLPEDRPAFVELGSSEGVPLWDEWVPHRKVCVATEAYSPRPRRTFEEDDPRGWMSARQTQPEWPEVESPEVGSWLQALVGWLETRVQVSGFDAKACWRWLERPEILSMIDTLGTALGLIGLFVTYAQKGGTAGPLVRARGLPGMARLFLRMRVQQAETNELTPEALWERLLHMSRHLVTENTPSWFEARPLDAWHALVRNRPDDADLDWLKELEPHGVKVDRAALDKARGRLPPDAFRTVRALQTLGLLRERQPRQYVFQPRWVLSVLVEQTIRETLEQAPSVWGGVLLRPDYAQAVLENLIERCKHNDFTPIHKVLAKPELSSPAWVAALEGSFRVLGVAMLEGVQVPEELRLGVLRFQWALNVPLFDGAPQPRIDYAHEYGNEHPLLETGIWYAALLLLAERSPVGSDLSIESWCKGMPAQTMRWVVQRATFMLDEGEHLPERWWVPLFLLGGRLMDRLPFPTQPGMLFEALVQPEQLLRRLQREDTTLQSLAEDISWDRTIVLLPEYARARGVEWLPLARKVWRLWLDEGRQELPRFLMPDEAYAPVFWQALPPEAVVRFVDRPLRWLLKNREAIYSFFKEEHWDAFLQAWVSLKESWWGEAPLAAIQRIPAEHVRKALRAGFPDGYDHSTRKLLWQRMPEVLCEEIELLFRQGQWDTVLRQAWAAPLHYVPRLLASAEAGLEQSDTPPPVHVSRWLHTQVANRAPGWEQAWKLLERVVPPRLPGAGS